MSSRQNVGRGKRGQRRNARGEDNIVDISMRNQLNLMGPYRVVNNASAQIVYVDHKIIPGPAFILACSAAGAIASATAMTLANFANTTAPSPWVVFDMVKIHKWGATVRAVNAESSANISGTTAFWFDQEDTTAPTFTVVSHRSALMLQNSAVAGPQSGAHIVFKPRGITIASGGVDWQNTVNGTLSPGSFKVYTDAANLGTQASAQNMWAIQPWLEVSFAGLN